MASTGLAPRRATLHLLNAVTEEGRLMSELLPKAVDALPVEDRARAVRLATTTLRWMDRADRVLGPFLRQKPPVKTLNILRLGTVELLVEGAAAHGVVNDLVTLAREDQKLGTLAGMVNAVLRKVAATPPEKWQALPAPLMPKWLRKPLLADYSKGIVGAIEQAQAAGAPLDISVKSDVEGWATRLSGTVLPTGSVRLPVGAQVSALPGFAEGAWWVQDAAAALPAQILAAQPGERVLDLCAAPGGKTMQFAASGADVTAVDSSDHRLGRLRENLARTGLTANVVVGDALTYSDAPFDAILLDAPCSATGTIRRHPDLPYAKTGEEFPALFSLQSAMLDHAFTLLRPGGRLVYCTCSLLFDEGEEQIKDLIERTPGIALDTAALTVSGVDPNWIGPYGLRTRPDYWPEAGGMDGFFVSVLRKLA